MTPCPHLQRVITHVSEADAIRWRCLDCGGEHEAAGWAAFDQSMPSEAEVRRRAAELRTDRSRR